MKKKNKSQKGILVQEKIEKTNFLKLCQKARGFSSMAKIGFCGKVMYSEKNRIISHVIEKFPSWISIVCIQGKYWKIALKDYGCIHLNRFRISEKAFQVLSERLSPIAA
jgi:hypothetical protein